MSDWYPSDRWRDTYDDWKLRSPDDEREPEPEDEPEPEYEDTDEDDLEERSPPVGEEAPFATEPTEQGNQFVIPGCEKDKSRGPNQMDLF